MLLGLLAIPLVIALIYLPAQASANCSYGNYPSVHDEVYFSGTVNATAGSYGVQGFVVTNNASHVEVDTDTNARILIVPDSQMANYTLGRNFTKVYDSREEYRYMSTMPADRYWIVLEATQSPSDISTHVTVQTRGPRMMPAKCDDPVPYTGIQVGLLAMVICIVSAVTIVVRKA